MLFGIPVGCGGRGAAERCGGGIARDDDGGLVAVEVALGLLRLLAGVRSGGIRGVGGVTMAAFTDVPGCIRVGGGTGSAGGDASREVRIGVASTEVEPSQIFSMNGLAGVSEASTIRLVTSTSRWRRAAS
ncbi:hypothetical protein ACFYN3_26790 [Streptomyces lavendulae]|uniref:hypothetical protein n=1 Tax=Streptomyces lavendulae TaxID=1914 RepID=UPI0033C74118